MTARTLLIRLIIALIAADILLGMVTNAMAERFLQANAHRLCFEMVDCKKPYDSH